MRFCDDWRVVEGVTLTTNRVSSQLAGLPQCQEREDLYGIAQMLINEGFDPEDFWVAEYPTKGVYNIERKGLEVGTDYFCISNDNGVLTPQYISSKLVDGTNQLQCKTIKDSIKLMEC